ncbi:MAG: AIR synthase-related protein, partial [bacterium]
IGDRGLAADGSAPRGFFGGEVAAPVPTALARARVLHAAIAAGHVRACHDLSEGGLLVALAEMCLGGRLGATIDLRRVPADGIDRTARAFAESSSRWLLEVSPEAVEAITECLAGHPWADLGEVGGDTLTVTDGPERLVTLPVATLRAAFARDPSQQDHP